MRRRGIDLVTYTVWHRVELGIQSSEKDAGSEKAFTAASHRLELERGRGLLLSPDLRFARRADVLLGSVLFLEIRRSIRHNMIGSVRLVGGQSIRLSACHCGRLDFLSNNGTKTVDASTGLWLGMDKVGHARQGFSHR
jgi:hypothetical protein